jgi:hypothetical protein
MQLNILSPRPATKPCSTETETATSFREHVPHKCVGRLALAPKLLNGAQQSTFKQQKVAA